MATHTHKLQYCTTSSTVTEANIRCYKLCKGTKLLSPTRQSWRQHNWHYCKISCPSGGHHCSDMSPYSTQMFLQALRIQTDLSTGRKPDVRWRLIPGRLRKTWCCHICTESECHPVYYWDACIYHIHSGSVTQRSTRASRWWWWWTQYWTTLQI